MRILVTNDDGVGAPGIAALSLAAVATGHDVFVVAPMIDYSGASAAVGPVHSRDGVDYERREIPGLEDVAVYGIDGPPALAVILACVGGFGQAPDIVVSGINHGANVGRSALHSGTVGATLTGAHFGANGLAVSIRYGEEPVPWQTPGKLAASLIPVVAEAPKGTVLNLNVPDLPFDALRGVRRGTLGRGGTIRSAVHDTREDSELGPGSPSHLSLPPFPTGTLRLDLTPPTEDSALDSSTDAGLIAHGYASITPLVGVRELRDESVSITVDTAVIVAEAVLCASTASRSR